MTWSLRLIEDRLPARATWDTDLPALQRILYVVAGDLILGATEPVHLGADQAWHGDRAVAGRAGDVGAHVLRFELARESSPSAASGSVLLEHPLAVDDSTPWLVRCDRVDFEPGGVALPHGHRGGGIRRLLRGRLDVTVGDHPSRVMRPGDAWFESGREPVLAVAPGDVETSFLRVAILPAEISGRTSIVYVNPDDAARSRPRTYTVYIDEPIALR